MNTQVKVTAVRVYACLVPYKIGNAQAGYSYSLYTEITLRFPSNLLFN